MFAFGPSARTAAPYSLYLLTRSCSQSVCATTGKCVRRNATSSLHVSRDVRAIRPVLEHRRSFSGCGRYSGDTAATSKRDGREQRELGSSSARRRLCVTSVGGGL